MSLTSDVGARSVLNLGSGLKPMAGAVNLDVAATTRPDVVHNLNVVPWPFGPNTFDEVHANDVIEHLDDTLVAMEEIHRISRPGAVVHITVPHFSSANAFTDPTHQHYFGYFSFHYFTGESAFPFYSNVKFRRRSLQLVFHPTLVNKLVWRLAARWPAGYERGWAWIVPAWFISLELDVIKNPQ